MLLLLLAERCQAVGLLGYRETGCAALDISPGA